MNPLYNLAAKALSVVIVPAVIGTSMIIPKHYNLHTMQDGTYHGYKYEADVTQHATMQGYQCGRVMEITVEKDGRIVAKLTSKGWEVINSEDKKEVQGLLEYLDKKMAREHHHGWAGI